MALKDYKTLAAIFEKYLSDHPSLGHPDTLYEPIRYINSLGGKRIRPVLLLMSYNLWFDDVTAALQPAMAIEYFHHFTLMHDDIMDEAAIRRGQESVHTRFGKNRAMLGGDAMLIKAFDYLIDFENNHRLGASISQALSKTALEICEGQQMDMDFEKTDSVHEEEYLEMIRKKTACLIGTCLRMGALLANAETEITDRLYSFGENIGMAFQIRDDLLDVFGDAQATGKQQGGDILQGKKNFLYVKTFNLLPEAEKSGFIESYSRAGPEHDIHAILETYDHLQLKEYAMEMQNHFFDRALHSLKGLPSLDTAQLRSFAHDLITRDH